jgi:hypothetical protein
MDINIINKEIDDVNKQIKQLEQKRSVLINDYITSTGRMLPRRVNVEYTKKFMNPEVEMDVDTVFGDNCIHVLGRECNGCRQHVDRNGGCGCKRVCIG